MASIVISLMLSQNRHYNKRIIGKNKKRLWTRNDLTPFRDLCSLFWDVSNNQCKKAFPQSPFLIILIPHFKTKLHVNFVFKFIKDALAVLFRRW